MVDINDGSISDIDRSLFYAASSYSPLNSVASLVIERQDKEIKLVKQQITLCKRIINLSSQSITDIVAILCNKDISYGMQLERIM